MFEFGWTASASMAPETAFPLNEELGYSLGTFSSPLLNSGDGPSETQFGTPNRLIENIVRSSKGSNHRRLRIALCFRVTAKPDRRLDLEFLPHRSLNCLPSVRNMADSSLGGIIKKRTARARTTSARGEPGGVSPRSARPGRTLLGGRNSPADFVVASLYSCACLT